MTSCLCSYSDYYVKNLQFGKRGVTETKDDIMWMYEPNGIYYVKSEYRAIQTWQNLENQSSRTSSSEVSIWKKQWTLHTIPRHVQ